MPFSMLLTTSVMSRPPRVSDKSVQKEIQRIIVFGTETFLSNKRGL